MFGIRRVGVALFILILVLSSVITSSKLKNADTEENVSRKVEVSGVITNIEEKKYRKMITVDKKIMITLKNSKPVKKYTFKTSKLNTDSFNIGDRVIVSGNEKNLYNLKIKDFNYGKYLLSKGYNKYIDSTYIKKIGVNKFYNIIGRLKNSIIKTNFYLYKKNSSILNALTVGYKNGLEEDDKKIFLDSGTSHIMAISGLHIGIICVILIIIFGDINSLFSLFLMYIVLNIYSKMVSQISSVERAINLLFVTYIGYFLDERVDLINILAIIASIMIIMNIYVIYNVSFQLSFLSVASICVYKKYIDKYIGIDILSVSIASMILTIPLVLHYFREVSMVGVFGNIVALPFIGIIIVLDLISVLLYNIDIPGYHILSSINNGIVDLVINLLDKIGNYGVNNIIDRDFSNFKIIVYYILVLSVSIYIYVYEIKKNKIIIEDNNKVNIIIKINKKK